MKFLKVITLILYEAVCAHAQAVGYQAPASDRYRVRMNGKGIFTYKTTCRALPGKPIKNAQEGRFLSKLRSKLCLNNV